MTTPLCPFVTIASEQNNNKVSAHVDLQNLLLLRPLRATRILITPFRTKVERIYFKMKEE